MRNTLLRYCCDSRRVDQHAQPSQRSGTSLIRWTQRALHHCGWSLSTEFEKLLRETITAGAATTTALEKLADALDSTAAQSEARSVKHATEAKADLLELRQNIAALADGIVRQTAATEARTEIWKSFAGLLRERWISLLVGLSAGLGITGAGQLLKTTVSALIGDPIAP